MAVSKFKTWIAGEVLNASDLNSSFDQVFNNGEDLGFPRTKDADFNGNALILDADADSELKEISDDIIGLQLTGVAGIFRWDGATAGGALTNGLTFEAQTTGNAVRIVAQGTDTDISIALVPKGTGTVTGVTAELVGDTTPQLGGQLDVNGFALGNGTLELLEFVETASAVNHIGITNAAIGNAPRIGIGATGTDTNTDLALIAAGTGDVVILDPADATAVWKFDPSTIATGTTRTLTMPDASGTIIFNVVEDTTPQLGGALDANSNAINMGDSSITRPEFIDYAETVNIIGSTGGGTQSIDLTLGNVATLTVDTSANTFTLDNPPATGKAGSITLIITNGGSQTVNWPASVDWVGGTAPSLTAAGRDVVALLTVDGGTIWYGFEGGLNFS